MSDSAYLRLYEPLDTPKPVAPDLWIVDGPVIGMDFPLGFRVPFTTRMTVVRLRGGGLWLHSPTRFTPELAERVRALGPVAHLVSPNFIHYAAVPDWSRAFPDATRWAAPGVRERAQSLGVTLTFDADLGDTPPPEWAEDLDQLLFAGSRVMREVVFLHRASRTAVLTDLIENIELDRVSWRWRWLLRLTGAADPDGKAPVDVRALFTDRDAARASLARLLAWAPERVILAHGRWYDRDGLNELRRAFRWLGAVEGSVKE